MPPSREAKKTDGVPLSSSMLTKLACLIALIAAFASASQWVPLGAGYNASFGNVGFPAGSVERIFVLIYENQAFSKVSVDPNFKAWAEKGQLLTNYWATSHPSQGNYLSQVIGGVFGYYDSGAIYDVTESNLVQLMEAKSVSW